MFLFHDSIHRSQERIREKHIKRKETPLRVAHRRGFEKKNLRTKSVKPDNPQGPFSNFLPAIISCNIWSNLINRSRKHE